MCNLITQLRSEPEKKVIGYFVKLLAVGVGHTIFAISAVQVNVPKYSLVSHRRAFDSYLPETWTSWQLGFFQFENSKVWWVAHSACGLLAKSLLGKQWHTKLTVQNPCDQRLEPRNTSDRHFKVVGLNSVMLSMIQKRQNLKWMLDFLFSNIIKRNVWKEVVNSLEKNFHICHAGWSRTCSRFSSPVWIWRDCQQSSCTWQSNRLSRTSFCGTIASENVSPTMVARKNYEWQSRNCSWTGCIIVGKANARIYMIILTQWKCLTTLCQSCRIYQDCRLLSFQRLCW